MAQLPPNTVPAGASLRHAFPDRFTVAAIQVLPESARPECVDKINGLNRYLVSGETRNDLGENDGSRQATESIYAFQFFRFRQN